MSRLAIQSKGNTLLSVMYAMRWTRHSHSGGIGTGVQSWERPPSDLFTGHSFMMCDTEWVSPSHRCAVCCQNNPTGRTGCTSPSVMAEMVEYTPLTSMKVKTRKRCWVINDVGVYWTVSLSGFSPQFLRWRHCVCGPHWSRRFQARWQMM